MMVAGNVAIDDDGDNATSNAGQRMSDVIQRIERAMVVQALHLRNASRLLGIEASSEERHERSNGRAARSAAGQG